MCAYFSGTEGESGIEGRGGKRKEKQKKINFSQSCMSNGFSYSFTRSGIYLRGSNWMETYCLENESKYQKKLKKRFPLNFVVIYSITGDSPGN